MGHFCSSFCVKMVVKVFIMQHAMTSVYGVLLYISIYFISVVDITKIVSKFSERHRYSIFCLYLSVTKCLSCSESKDMCQRSFSFSRNSLLLFHSYHAKFLAMSVVPKPALAWISILCFSSMLRILCASVDAVIAAFSLHWWFNRYNIYCS